MMIPLEFVRSMRARLEGLLSAFFLAKDMSALTRVIIILPSNLKRLIAYFLSERPFYYEGIPSVLP